MVSDGKKYERSTDYNILVKPVRHRASRVTGRSLEEEIDADRGRVLFCPAFRRLQNKAQVFSLEMNAAIRSRLTHSLEVSSVGRYVAQQALKNFSESELSTYGLVDKERAVITIVETACLLHDIGNPPFGHFGEVAISDWFHQNESEFRPENIGGALRTKWDRYYSDFMHFDGNPQGFRIITKLQAKERGDLSGMNLTASTLAATMKYPWSSEAVNGDPTKKKAGYYQTEIDVVEWIRDELGIGDGERYPLVYLMEAADDIAYCLSDIEDGFEKGLVSRGEFAHDLLPIIGRLRKAEKDSSYDNEFKKMELALADLAGIPTKGDAKPIPTFDAMDDFRSSFIRYCSRSAGLRFKQHHTDNSPQPWPALLKECADTELLLAVKNFAENRLYQSNIVRDRELTAHAVLSGLLDAYRPLMACPKERFDSAIDGSSEDGFGRKITGEQSLVSRMPNKYMAVYHEEIRRANDQFSGEKEIASLLEKIHRIRMIVDFISGMTDEYALQTFKLVKGIDVVRN